MIRWSLAKEIYTNILFFFFPENLVKRSFILIRGLLNSEYTLVFEHSSSLPFYSLWYIYIILFNCFFFFFFTCNILIIRKYRNRWNWKIVFLLFIFHVCDNILKIKNNIPEQTKWMNRLYIYIYIDSVSSTLLRFDLFIFKKNTIYLFLVDLFSFSLFVIWYFFEGYS